MDTQLLELEAGQAERLRSWAEEIGYDEPGQLIERFLQLHAALELARVHYRNNSAGRVYIAVTEMEGVVSGLQLLQDLASRTLVSENPDHALILRIINQERERLQSAITEIKSATHKLSQVMRES